MVERDLLRRRLSLRATGTLGLTPSSDEEATGAAGLGVEFRPIPIHGVFGEAQVPFSAPDQLTWAAGLRLYTDGHVFALFASSTPALSPWELGGPAESQIAVGGSFERAFWL